MDIDALKPLATILLKTGAPLLGTILGGVPGAVASTILTQLASAYDAPAEPKVLADKIASDPKPAKLVEKDQGPALASLWQMEAKRVSEAQAAELEKGFGVWQIAKACIQAVVWGGWLAILNVALLGGNLGVKPLMPLPDLVGAWTTVTLVWMAVYNGGHTVKEVFGGWLAGPAARAR